MQQIIKAGYRNTAGVFKNLTRTTAHTATRQFENALDGAWLEMTSGGFEHKTAIKSAIKQLTKNGLSSITYPYWRTTASYSTQLSGLIALFRFPFYTGGTWWISKYSDEYFKTIENKGNVPIEFDITFTARADLANPEVYHVDTGQIIAIEKQMKAGDRIQVSTVYGRRGVVAISAQGEVSNGFKYLSINSDLSIALLPGSNLLRTDALTGRENLGIILNAPEGVRSGV